MSGTNDNTITVKKLERRETDYQDLGRIRFEELEDDILNLSNTFKDKWTFTVFCMGLYATFFLAGWAPNYFYLWYTLIVLFCIPYRWHMYKQKRLHYITLELCYYVNVLVLLYLWAPLEDTIRGYMFPVVFSLSTGIYIIIVTLGSANVLHSSDKMTHIFLHNTPAFALAGIRYYSTDDQGFPLCGNPTQPGPDGCDHVGVFELFVAPTIAYLIWVIGFVLIVEVLLAKRMERLQNGTLYTLLMSTLGKRNSVPYRFYTFFGLKYTKPMYYVSNALVFILFLPLNCYYFHSARFFFVVASLILLSGSYNGASYYIEVFSKHYYSERVERKRRLSSLSKFN